MSEGSRQDERSIDLHASERSLQNVPALHPDGSLRLPHGKGGGIPRLQRMSSFQVSFFMMMATKSQQQHQ